MGSPRWRPASGNRDFCPASASRLLPATMSEPVASEIANTMGLLNLSLVWAVTALGGGGGARVRWRGLDDRAHGPPGLSAAVLAVLSGGGLPGDGGGATRA